MNAVSSNSAELRGSATAIAWFPSSNTISTDLYVAAAAAAAACEREGRYRVPLYLGNWRMGPKAVAVDCKGIRSLKSGEL